MYTFKKSQAPQSTMDYSSQICSIFSIDSNFEENMARFPGQLKYLFEDMLSYIIEATDESGNTLLLNVYSAGTGPAIGGHYENDREAYQKAAHELAAYISQADASDYEYEGYYLDGPSKIEMGVENGKSYYKETEMSDEEVSEIFKRFGY